MKLVTFLLAMVSTSVFAGESDITCKTQIYKFEQYRLQREPNGTYTASYQSEGNSEVVLVKGLKCNFGKTAVVKCFENGDLNKLYFNIKHRTDVDAGEGVDLAYGFYMIYANVSHVDPKVPRSAYPEQMNDSGIVRDEFVNGDCRKQ